MKISIITVCYNSIKHIENCLASIKSQNYKDIESILIDGGSTDGTLSLLKSRNHKFSTLISEPDKGIYDAMNKGIRHASGDVIGFLNSDDYYVNNEIISKVATVFNCNSAIDACYADLIYVDQLNTSKIIRHVKSAQYRKGLFSIGWCAPHPTFFVRRSVFDRLGNFDLRYKIAPDFDLIMRFLEVNKIKSKYVSEIWVKMRTGGISNKNLKNIFLQNLEVLSALKKNNIPFSYFRFFYNKLFYILREFL